MPRVPPRPLCLPELLSDPQTKADYIQANPSRYGPNSRPASTSEEGCIPPSPSSIYGSERNRHSQTTSFGLPSPPSTASLTSTHTSLSIHNGITHGISSMVDSKRSSITSQSSNKEKRSSRTWSISNITLGGDTITAVNKPRATWSNTFKTRSWFGNAAAASEAKQENVRNDSSHQVEIKLSPSMIAAVAEKQVSQYSRPVSSPYPLSNNATRSPRIGVGLKYYTEKNPAPPDIRKQIPGLIDLGESEHSTSSIPTMTNPRPPEKSVSLTLPSFSTGLHWEKPLPGIKISFGASD
ncbi:hypothetical protein Clacol_008152 [Clathrus columnatus]|uniref:Uncharacterized protein n=1 Tax=Clathrus columnatus TaxID=1419009 RepID=A0AAV5AM06_9AGAM|nr:hypothetical protein Clacol_008152 [Clathrus columnatus]